MTDSQLTQSPSVVKASYWFPDGESGQKESSVKLIDSTLFTHLICAFADLDPNTKKVSVSNKHEYVFSTFTDIVREKNPHVKTLLSIGGKNAEKSVFASMASNPTSRKAFIHSSIEIARKNKFHGLDLAWEYPSNEMEMTNFGKLLQEWRQAVTDESDKTNAMPLLLTAAVYYSSDYNSVSYPVPVIVDTLDWVNVIAFDFYGPGWSTVTGPTAALADSDPTAPSGDSGLKKWIKAGLPKKKVVLGLSYVAWAWSLEHVNHHGYGAPTTGPAISADGSINFVEVRKYIAEEGATMVHDPTVIGDYCYVGATWIGYDDFQSIVAKANYAKEQGLLGYFAWHVGADDHCGLSRAASQAWNALQKTTAK